MDLILHGGTLLTSEALASPTPTRSLTPGSMPTAIAIRSGRIAAIGSDADILRLATGASRRIHLEGRTLSPGFNDAHAHIWKIGHLLTSQLDLRRTSSLAQLTKQLQMHAATLTSNAWLLGRGLNEALLTERRLPTRHDLDRIVPNRPVLLTRTCGHIVIANSLALRLAGITTNSQPPAGGIIERDDRGEPTGLLHENAMSLVNAAVPPPTQSEYQAMILAATRHQISLGITSTSDCGVNQGLLSAYRVLDAENALPARVNVMPLHDLGAGLPLSDLPPRTISPRLRIDTVKFLADGGLSGATAALSVPYPHTGSRGVVRFDPAHLCELMIAVHNAGWRIATHAIGDVAIGQVLTAYASLDRTINPVRHRIEHLGLPTPDHLVQAAALGIIAVPQAIFLPALGRNFRNFVPEALFNLIYPIRSMLRTGLTVALSSDGPVVEDDSPLSGIAAAVLRHDDTGSPILSHESISAAEALIAYTHAGAVCTGDEAQHGTLAVGQRADLAVLSANPLDALPTELAQIHIDITLLDGELVYQR